MGKIRKRRIRQLLAISSLAGLLAVTGCSTNTPNPAHNTSTSAQTAQPVVGLGIGDLAPDFSVPMSDGNTLKLSKLRGKPVFLNFWATWCPPCQMEMPDIQKISKENYPVQIMGINLKEAPMTVEGFLSRKGYTFPVGFDLKGNIALLYNASGIPTSYAIDAQGIIRHVHTGPLTYAELKQWFTDLSQTAK